MDSNANKKPELSTSYVGDASLFVSRENKLIERVSYEELDNAVSEVQECVSLGHMAAQGFDFALISPEKIQHAFDLIQKTSDRMEREVDELHDTEKDNILIQQRARRLKNILDKLEYANGELIDAVRELARAEIDEERAGEKNEGTFRKFEKNMMPASPTGFNMIQGQLDYFTGEFPDHTSEDQSG